MNKVRVIVADDHDIVRFGICSVLKSAPDIEVVGEASDGQDLIDLYMDLYPDVAIVDISMPNKDGIDTTIDLLKKDPNAKVLILTMHMDEEYLNRAIKAGALGYLLKNCDKEELLNGIRDISQGKKIFSSAVSKMITESYITKLQEDEHKKEEESKSRIHLTNREKEILNLISNGMTSQEIAKTLFISPRTVETHRANLLQKLDIKNTAGLVRFAIENGFTHEKGK